jgi:hypothetical protein
MIYNGLPKSYTYYLELPIVQPFRITYPDNYNYFADCKRNRTLLNIMFEVKPFHPDPDEVENCDDSEDETEEPIP